MVLVKAKLDGAVRTEGLERRRIRRWLEEQIGKSSHQLLFGCHGMGKTTALLGFARNNYKNRYGYYCLDKCDNDVTQFQAYFVAMMRNAGLQVDAHVQKENLHETMCRFLKLLEAEEEQKFLIFDGIQYLNDPDIIEEIFLFTEYVGEKCAVILLCDDYLPDIWKKAFGKGIFSVMSARELALNQEELSQFLSGRRYQVRHEDLRRVLKYTGGWPGILRAVDDIGRKNMQDNILTDTVLALAANEFVNRNIWNFLPEYDRKIILYAGFFPYVNEAFFREVLHLELRGDELLWFMRAGVLEYDRAGDCFRLSEEVKEFAKREAERMAAVDVSEIQQAFAWYDARQSVWEAVFCLDQMKDYKALADYLAENLQYVIVTLEQEELRRFVGLVPEADRPELWFLKGFLAIRDENYAQADEIEYRMNAMCRELQGEELLRMVELLLNLWYVDVRIDAVEWLITAEDYLKKISAGSQTKASSEENGGRKIRLYTLTGNVPDICCGTKDLTPFFIDGVKQQREYRKRWCSVICEEQERCFDLAEIEYFLETNREQQAIEGAHAFLTQPGNITEPNQLMSMAGIMCKLYRKGLNDVLYENIIQFLMKELKEQPGEQMSRNAEVCRIYYEAWRGSRARLAGWVQYEAPVNMYYMNIGNVYLYLMKAKGLLSLHQYAKAYPILESLTFFFKKRNKPLYLIESMFGEAVALYAMNRQTEALKLATQALTLGVRYHYVGVYCQYGKNGCELIELFQNMIEGRERKFSQGKRKYYYGNIINASYEQYQEILLRTAKKEAKRYATEEGVADDHLTMTELLILKYVSSGMANQEVADEMHIKLQTVKTHLYSIYRKLGVKSRVAAVNKAKENGML